MDSEQWNERYAVKELVWHAEPNRFVEERLSGVAPGRALDVACGEGRNAIWLASQGWEVTAVDFSDVAIGKGRELATRFGVTVDWVVADVLTHTPEAGAFDLVLWSYLQLPEPARSTAMSASRAALKPGGRFFMVAHDLSNIEHGHGGPQAPEVLPTPEITVALLPGFEIEVAEVVERPVESEGERHVALDTLVSALAP